MINPVVRNNSPLPIRDIPTHPKSTPRRRRLRDSSSLAAACFDIEEDEKDIEEPLKARAQDAIKGLMSKGE